MSLIKLIEFDIHGDERGSLIALEQYKNIPFDIKRIYYIFDTKHGVTRGFHAHKNLSQVAVCVKGSCKIVLDDGKNREEAILNSPSKGLLIDGYIWREMHDFTKDCVLVVLANNYYDTEDYIWNYSYFINWVNNNAKK